MLCRMPSLLSSIPALAHLGATGPLDVVALPSLENDLQAAALLHKRLKDNITPGRVFAGSFSEMDMLLNSSGAGEADKKRFQAVLAGTDLAMATCSPLRDTLAVLDKPHRAFDLMVCALPPETSFKNPFSTAEFRHSTQRESYRLHRFGDAFGKKLEALRQQVRQEMVYEEKLVKAPLASVAFGLLCFKPHGDVQKGNWNEHSSIVDQLFHELTHYADLSVFDQWVEANLGCLEASQKPDSLFGEFALDMGAQHFLPMELYHLFTEIRAYYVSACLIGHSEVFQRSGRSFDDLLTEVSQKVYLQLQTQGLKPLMDYYEITPDSLFEFVEAPSNYMKLTNN